MHDLDGGNEEQLVALPTSPGMQFTRKQYALCAVTTFPTTLVAFSSIILSLVGPL